MLNLRYPVVALASLMGIRVLQVPISFFAFVWFWCWLIVFSICFILGSSMISSSVSSSTSQTDQATSPTSKIWDSWEELFVVDCILLSLLFFVEFFEALQWLMDQCRVAALAQLIQALQVMIGWWCLFMCFFYLSFLRFFNDWWVGI